MNAIQVKEDELLPWDQTEAEPAQHYKYFLYYLNTGITRTVRKASMAFHADMDDEARLKDEVADIPLHEWIREWQNLASKWEWVRRADAYDIETLKDQGKMVMKRMGEALEKASEKILKALEDDTMKPANFKELMDGIHGITALIPRGESLPGSEYRSPPKRLGR